MFEIDTSTLSGVLSSLWQLAGGALRMDPNVYQAAVTQPGGTELAIFLLFLAGLSVTLGQSVVLFANRIRRQRFILSLVVFAAVFVVGALAWAATIWLMANWIFDVERDIWSVITVVALSYSPFLFGLLILLPYLRNIISAGLRIWVFLNVLIAIQGLYSFHFFAALIASVLGWLLIELLTQLKFLRIDRLDDWIWRVTTGTPQELKPKDMVSKYIEMVKRPVTETPQEQTNKESKL